MIRRFLPAFVAAVLTVSGGMAAEKYTFPYVGPGYEIHGSGFSDPDGVVIVFGRPNKQCLLRAIDKLERLPGTFPKLPEGYNMSDHPETWAKFMKMHVDSPPDYTRDH